MQHGGLRTQAIVTFAIVSVVTLAGFTLVSHFAAKDYTTRLSVVARPLHRQIQTFEQTTYVSLFDDPTAPDAQQQKISETILRQSDSIMAGVATLSQTTATLQPIPWADLNGEYQKAYLLQAKSRSSTTQITDAITHYRALVNFLKTYSHTQARLQAQFDSFNAIHDFNQYIGQGDKFRAIAVSLRQSAQPLQSAPQEARPLQTTLTGFLSRTADEFDALALALDSGSDPLIYAAASRIEAIERQISTYDQTNYTKILANSRTLRNIRGLGDALDLLQ